MKKLLNVMTCLLSTTMLVACVGGPEGESEAVFKPMLDTTTECSLTVVGDYKNFEALEDEFDKFNEYYPNVTLSYVYKDGYVSALGAALESEDKPNIFFSYASWMTGDEKYASIVPHMENLLDSNLKLHLDSIRSNLIKHDADNNVFMVPIFSRTFGMLVNNDLFKREGLNVPNTWDELLSVCSSLVQKGYESPMMGYIKKNSDAFTYTIAYPSFVAALAKVPGAIKLANNLDPAAGEYMRDGLEQLKALTTNGAIDVDVCNDSITDNYNDVIKTFFKGDVPMMILPANTASGTRKRETDEEYPYLGHEFDYSFVSVPVTNEGGYFIDSPAIQFSVNKDCENLDMTNEFMRFLIRTSELNNMASIKRLVSPAKEMTFDKMYKALGDIPAERIFSPEALGVEDPLTQQIKAASYKVIKENLPIEDAIAQYGTF